MQHSRRFSHDHPARASQQRCRVGVMRGTTHDAWPLWMDVSAGFAPWAISVVSNINNAVSVWYGGN